MSSVGADAGLLERIEEHFDAAPRSAADVEEHGALTLFVSRIPWRFYGRPRLGLEQDVGADDVAALRARQRELGVREALEWVHETTPSLAGAARGAGLEVLQVPLLALASDGWSPPPAPAGVTLRMLAADDPSLPAAQAVVELAFAAEGMELGDVGPEARDLAAAQLGDLAFLRDRLRGRADRDGGRGGRRRAARRRLAPARRGRRRGHGRSARCRRRAAAASAPPSPGGSSRTRATAAPTSSSSRRPATTSRGSTSGSGSTASAPPASRSRASDRDRAPR